MQSITAELDISVRQANCADKKCNPCRRKDLINKIKSKCMSLIIKNDKSWVNFTLYSNNSKYKSNIGKLGTYSSDIQYLLFESSF